MILTTYDADTLEALKFASSLPGYRGTCPVLVSLSDITDSIQQLLFLSEENTVDEHKRNLLMSGWSRYSAGNVIDSSWRVREHHQFGISRQIVDALIERFDIDLVIVPPSVQQATEEVYKRFTSMLEETVCPVMLLPTQTAEQDGMTRTLLIGYPGGKLHVAFDRMSLDIVHHMETEDNDQLLLLLVDALRIQLVVQAKGEYRHRRLRPNEMLDVAVLCI